MASNRHILMLKLTLLIALAVAAIVPATTLAATADLSIAKQDSADPVQVGAELTYTITVANAGPDTANAVVVSDKLPGSVDVLGTESSPGSCDVKGRHVTCTLGGLPNAATATVTIRVMPNKEGTIENTATVSSAETDAYKPNDSDTELTTVIPALKPPTCAGQAATIVGSDGADTLVGTPESDVIVGLGGDDSIDGLGGNDLVCAKSGNDAIRARGGNDIARGGGGNDQVRGGGGNDQVRGGGGNDTVRGGGGNDELKGGGGADVCFGGPGTDTKRGC